jgi:hypothetical protein
MEVTAPARPCKTDVKCKKKVQRNIPNMPDGEKERITFVAVDDTPIARVYSE